MGKYCQCNKPGMSTVALDEKCKRTNESAICEGRGKCNCGICECIRREVSLNYNVHYYSLRILRSRFLVNFVSVTILIVHVTIARSVLSMENVIADSVFVNQDGLEELASVL